MIVGDEFWAVEMQKAENGDQAESWLDELPATGKRRLSLIDLTCNDEIVRLHAPSAEQLRQSQGNWMREWHAKQ